MGSARVDMKWLRRNVSRIEQLIPLFAALDALDALLVHLLRQLGVALLLGLRFAAGLDAVDPLLRSVRLRRAAEAEERAWRLASFSSFISVSSALTSCAVLRVSSRLA